MIRSLVDNPPENLIEALLQNKDLYSQNLWYKYSQMTEYKESVKRKSYRCKVSYKRNGLAAHLYVRCLYSTKKTSYRPSTNPPDTCKGGRNVPFLHATGNHSECNPIWRLANKAIDHGKEYSQKPLLPSQKFDREIEQVWEIHEKYTSDQRLLQMRHSFDTQMKESFNMRIAEFAPKSKTFSRSDSLQHRVHHAIAIHNLGYRGSYSEIFASIKIPNCSVFDEWKKQKERKKHKKRAYDRQIKNKRKQAYKTEEKKKELLYLERSITP